MWCPANKVLRGGALREPGTAIGFRSGLCALGAPPAFVKLSEMLRPVRVLTWFSMTNGVPASHLLNGPGRDSSSYWRGRVTRRICDASRLDDYCCCGGEQDARAHFTAAIDLGWLAELRST